MFSLIDALFSDPLWFLEYSLYRVPAVLLALVLHEWAHGFVAWRLGDPTAKEMGRLSLNPLRHLDPLGTLMMFFLGFGWAKPVPVNPNNFSSPHRDDLLVSLAGITMNLTLFLLFTVASVILSRFLWIEPVLRSYSLKELLGYGEDIINYILMGYGQDFAEYFARPGLLWVLRLCSQVAMVNLFIGIFNLLPVPPLDGSHVANDLLFKGQLFAHPRVAQIGMGVLLLLSFSGLLGKGLSFVGNGLQSGVLSLISAVMGVF